MLGVVVGEDSLLWRVSSQIIHFACFCSPYRVVHRNVINLSSNVLLWQKMTLINVGAIRK